MKHQSNLIWKLLFAALVLVFKLTLVGILRCKTSANYKTYNWVKHCSSIFKRTNFPTHNPPNKKKTKNPNKQTNKKAQQQQQKTALIS